MDSVNFCHDSARPWVYGLRLSTLSTPFTKVYGTVLEFVISLAIMQLREKSGVAGASSALERCVAPPVIS